MTETPLNDSVATRTRYRTVGFFISMAVLLYLHRFCLSPATTTMIREFGVSKADFGNAVAAFFFTYALMQVPAGWLADRVGSRYCLTAYVATWSFVTILLGFANSLAVILVVRLILGVAQAGAYPAASSALGKWIPVEERARASSVTSMGGRIGAVLALALTPILMSAVASATGWKTGHWRPVFIGYGILGLIWAVVFFRWFRDSAEDHPQVNTAEAAQITRGKSQTPQGKSEPTESLRHVLTSANLWALCWISVLINIGWIFLATWMPTYLEEHYAEELSKHFGSVVEAGGILTAVTSAAGVTGNFFGGWLADGLRLQFGLRWGRRIPGMISGVVACVLYQIGAHTDNVWVFVTMMACIYFVIDMSLGALWAIYQDISRSNVGSASALPNMCGNFAASFGAKATGLLADQGNWGMVFNVSSWSLLVAAVSWLLVFADRPMTTIEKEA